ncbi:hypothetical protein BYT27DRAFT_6860451 [Phlegmacium glaucopus]|nr:hypothetical protein BYT27DRAFT_6860451 [Phlegmacium glaucopus]
MRISRGRRRRFLQWAHERNGRSRRLRKASKGSLDGRLLGTRGIVGVPAFLAVWYDTDVVMDLPIHNLARVRWRHREKLGQQFHFLKNNVASTRIRPEKL